MIKKLLLSTALVVSPFFSSAQASSITYSTGDFIDSEWSTIISPSSNGTSIASTETTGGNPDAYRRVSLAVDPFEFVQNNQIWNAVSYNPSTEGAAESVALSYHVARVATSNSSATQIAIGVAVLQDAELYTAFFGTSIASAPLWEVFSLSDITPFFTDVNWTTGTAIQFGFFDSVGTSATGFVLDGGYDNFSVTISSVPVPAAVWLFGSGLLGLVTMARRRKVSR